MVTGINKYSFFSDIIEYLPFNAVKIHFQHDILEALSCLKEKLSRYASPY
ncbi:hypothetical protein CPS_2999 [Colwellia psychrerythraea 34H]|uniref:Uncharacterized protein n=1 Tax=Colwellia psychrerythraea (strain 34H / ATCC BAA-681) TaxID=167879 RepID=Q47ZS1_COLP3|nr:hypothetical protein CPS_2999 [Colwellia psychrerythraea 34H]